MNIKERTKIAIYVVLLLISVIVDILILNGWLKTYLIVSNNYIASVFSGILTYSTLSLTVLSIIVAIIDVKVYGLKLKEILLFKSSPIKFISFIIFLAVLTFLSIIALAFNMCTFISFIAVISILHITQTSVNIFKIVLNNNLAKEIIFEEIKSNNSDFLFNYVVSWINEYKNALTNNNISEIEEYAEILKKCVSNQEIVKVIKKQLPDLFDAACQYHSFPDSYYLVVKSLSMYHYETNHVLRNYIKRIQYYGEYQLIKLNLHDTISDIITSNILNSDEKVTLSYYIFNALIYCNVKEEVKNEILEKCINKISVIKEDQNGVEKGELIYLIFICDIILEDSGINLNLYKLFLKSLYLKNVFNSEKVYIETIARIFRAMYFYGILAVDILSEEKRNQIKRMAECTISLDKITPICLPNLILYQNIYGTLCFYISDSYNLNEFNYYYNYGFSNYINEKKDIFKGVQNVRLWSYKNKIKFAVWFFFAAYFLENRFPLTECLAEMQKNQDLSKEISIDLCNAILKEYEDDLYILTDSCLKKVENFGDYLNKNIDRRFISPQKIRSVRDEVIRKIQEYKNHS